MKFIVRKIVEADSVKQAIKIEKSIEPIDCYLHPNAFDKVYLSEDKKVKGF